MQCKVFMNSVPSFRRLLCNLPEFYQIQLRSRRRGRPDIPIYGHWNWDISTVYRILFRFRPGRRGTAGAVKSGASRPSGAKQPKHPKGISENMNSFYKPFLVYWTMSRFPPRDCRGRNRTNRRKRHEEKYSSPRQPLRIQGNASAPAVDPPPGLQHELAVFVGSLTPLMILCAICGVRLPSAFFPPATKWARVFPEDVLLLGDKRVCCETGKDVEKWSLLSCWLFFWPASF